MTVLPSFPKVHFDYGTIDALPQELAARGVRRPLIITILPRATVPIRVTLAPLRNGLRRVTPRHMLMPPKCGAPSDG